MRRLVVMAALCLASAVSAAPRSNPPFLGIGLDDRNPLQNGKMGVEVTMVTPGTGAAEAGLQPRDLIYAIDDKTLLDSAQFNAWQVAMTSPTATAAIPKGPVEVLIERITAHEIGDAVHLGVVRNGQKLTIDAVLSSRADVLHHHLVDKSFDVPVEDVETARHYNLDQLTGKTTIVGWVFQDRQTGRSCVGCSRVLQNLDDKLHKLHPSDAPRVLEVTNEDARTVKKERTSEGTLIDTAVTSDEAMRNVLVVSDAERVHLAVVDCKGIVRFVAPLSPGADDEDAVYDEVLAAVEQAEHRAHR